jgi:signal transduction histidine kinase
MRRLFAFVRHPVRQFIDFPIRAKLTVLTVGIAVISLSLASVVFSIYLYRTSFADQVRNVEITAGLIAAKTAAALEFNDEVSAVEDLRVLSTQSNIIAAALYDNRGDAIASYASEWHDHSRMPKKPGPFGYVKDGNILTMYRPVSRNGQYLGTIGIRSDLHELNKAIREIVLIFFASILTLSVGAYLLARRAQHFVTSPILRLTETVRAVSERKDYTTRAERISNDEVGYLVDRFNEMLDVMREHENVVWTEATMKADLAARDREQAELRRFAERLERSNRDLQEFASVASHDLQEPLRKVLAFGERLVSGLNGTLDERNQDYLNRMMNATRRMQTLINDLLQYSRVSTKAQPSVRVELPRLLDEVVADLEVRLERTRGTVEYGALPAVLADPLQMHQLMLNLIGNALKYHRPDEPPRVVISGEVVTTEETESGPRERPSPVVRITVTDNGIGFDDKYSQQIFTIFQRLHGQQEYEGTGIGLAICKKIVERHGGTITAKGLPGEGAVFTLELPFASTESVDPAETGDPAQDTENPTQSAIADPESGRTTIGMAT